MLRVLQVVTHMNRGGLETMLMNYYRKIDRTQLQFDFLTHRPYDGDYGAEIQALGGIIYHLPVLNPFSCSYKRKLGAFFDAHPEYQIIHVHQDCLSGVILQVAKEHGVKVRIAHSHSSRQDINLKYPIKLIYRRLIAKYATALFACGKNAGDWMFCGAPFTVINNAIDTAAYAFNPEIRAQQRAALKIPEGAIVVGHVGRFSPTKNHAFLIDIFAALRQAAPNVILLLVGNDAEGTAPEIKQKVSSLGLDDNVIFAGLRSDVAAMLQAMDVFVFPSKYEGLPLSIIEAQTCGLPCLISDKVPGECIKTDLVSALPLEAAPELWANKALTFSATPRRDTCNEITAAGFDVGENAKWLTQFYTTVLEHER